jgi:hypothetical protein
MRNFNDEKLADDLILGIWAAIVLLGTARYSPDTGKSTDLLSKAERILSGVMPHITRLGSIGSLGLRTEHASLISCSIQKTPCGKPRIPTRRLVRAGFSFPCLFVESPP